MRRNPAAALLGAILASALVAAGIASAHQTAAAAAQTCPPRGAHLIAHNRILRVYTTGTLTQGRAVEACLSHRHGRMTLLAARAPGAGLGGRSLAVDASSGPLVAYSLTSFGVDSGSVSLRVADVAARRVLRELSVGRYVDAGFGGYERVTKVVLGPEGALGWIAAAKGPGPATAVSYYVRAAATIGQPRVLDEGEDIGATALSLTGRTLHWWHAGIEHSALLP